MTQELFANNYTSTLNGSITSGATSVLVNNAPPSALAATGQWRLLCGTEIMLVTSVSGSTLTVTRGVEGTTAAPASHGAAVEHVLTAGAVNMLPQLANNLSDLPSASTARLNLGADASGAAASAQAAAIAASAPRLVPSTTIYNNAASPVTATTGVLHQIDLTSGNVTLNYPSAPTDASQVAWKIVKYTGSNTLTINCGGSDVFEVSGGNTSSTPTIVLDTAKTHQYQYSSGIWFAVTGDTPIGRLATIVSPSGDTTGVTDTVALTTLGASAQIRLAPGTYWVKLLGLTTGMNIEGAGRVGQGSAGTVLRLPVSANCDLIQSSGFQTATGGGSWAHSITTARLANLTLDGNSGAQSPTGRTDSTGVSYSAASAVVTDPAISSVDLGSAVVGTNIPAGCSVGNPIIPGTSFTLIGAQVAQTGITVLPTGSGTSITITPQSFPLRTHAYDCDFDNVDIQNGYSGNWYSEGGSGAPGSLGLAMEHRVRNVRCISPTAGAFANCAWAGPHDSQFLNFQCIATDAGTGATHGTITYGYAGGEQFTNVHNWGVQHTNAWTLLRQAYLDGEGEGASTAQVNVLANDCMLSGSFYNSIGANTAKGIVLGQSGNTVSGTHIDAYVWGCNTSLLDRTYSTGNGIIRLTGYSTATTGVVGEALTNELEIVEIVGGASGSSMSATNLNLYGSNALLVVGTNQKFNVNASSGAVQLVNGAQIQGFSGNYSGQTVAILSATGAIQPGNLAGGTAALGVSIYSGSGAPSKPGNVNPTAGDIYIRSDAPGVLGEIIYQCTTGGASPVWQDVISLLAPLASPTLTGTPNAPTAPVGTNTTQLATTAFSIANSGVVSPPVVITSTNPSLAVPSGAGHAIIEAVGGGGSGGGGGAASSAITQVGGGGGAAGQYLKQYVSLSGVSSLAVTIGAGATGGTAGSAGGGAGGSPSLGTNTTITGGAISITAYGGGSGIGGGNNSTTTAQGGYYGTISGGNNGYGWAGGGGGASSSSGEPGGAGIGLSGRGGSGGAPASTTLGGTAGTFPGNNTSHTGTTTGATPSNAPANTGQGGDGGGGGSYNGGTGPGAGGAGGNGGSGLVLITWLP